MYTSVFTASVPSFLEVDEAFVYTAVDLLVYALSFLTVTFEALTSAFFA